MDETRLILSPLVTALLKVYQEREKSATSAVSTIRVSRTVSAAAFIVERIRNAIEFRDESLMRRAAIERFLKRRLVLNEEGEGIAGPIIRELIWAKYLPNNGIPESMIAQVQTVISKYFYLRRILFAHVKSKEQIFFSQWIFDVVSCEVEETLAVTKKRDAFINFMYQQVQSAIHIKDADEISANVQIYIAVSKVIAKSDRALLRYQLLKLLDAEFKKKTKQEMEAFVPEMTKRIRMVESQLHYPLSGKLFRFVRRNASPYLIFKDLLVRSDVILTLSSEETLRTAVWDACGKRYSQTGQRLRRLAIRSIIYIFLTKMIFALLVEVPVDRLLLGEVALIPLAINTTFPILLMAFIALTHTPPGESNTERIYSRIKEIIVHVPAHDDFKTQFAIRQTVVRPVLTFIFTILYGILFFAVFGAIILLLGRIGFTLASQFIFVFFLCVVTFFGYQVYQTASEYRYNEKESLFGPIFDFLLLPILHVGQWLSSEVTAGISGIFTFIFDFFFEMPLKTLFEIIEEWFSFIRNKKEELT